MCTWHFPVLILIIAYESTNILNKKFNEKAYVTFV